MDEGFIHPVLVIDAWCLRDTSTWMPLMEWVLVRDMHDSLLALIRPNRKSSYSNASISMGRNAGLVTSVNEINER